MRARNIKPGFFKNEELAEVEPLGRLLFQGLWCMADREGRLEDRPKRIKVEVLPYDAISDKKLTDFLNILHDKGFIIRYSVNGGNYIQIINFNKHQHLHHKEQESIIPGPDYNQLNPGQTPDKPQSCPGLAALKDESLNMKDERGKMKVSGQNPDNQKTLHLDFVLLTDDEYKKLEQEFGEECLKGKIERLNNYIGSTGKKYKSHYFTILNWDRRDGPNGKKDTWDEIKQWARERDRENGIHGTSDGTH